MTGGTGRASFGGLAGAGMLPPVDPAPTARPTARKQTRGRFAEINGFIDVTLKDLKPSEIAIWLILWRDTKPNGLVQTGESDLARRSGYRLRMVKYAVAGLVAKRLIKVVRQGRIGTSASVYKVRGVNPGGGK
ncbi:MAG: transcriptional regulator [Gemmataceae bacterium]|nr:transcriptional regulator [Gemmataceae bacterium]